MGTFLAATAWWVRPIALFLSGRRPGMRELALRRFNGCYAFLAGAWLINLVWGTLHAWLLYPKSVPGGTASGFIVQYALVDVFSAYYGIVFTVLYLEPLFFMKVAARFHDEPALFARKEGIALSLRTKLLLLVVNLIVIPLSLLGASLALPRPENAVSNDLMMIVVLLAYALGYSEMLYRGVTAPLQGLVVKMDAVRRGDYSQRTTVLAGDEIGRLKAHFNDMVEGLAERERLRDTFGRYVSVEVAKRLLESGQLRLGGESIEATILFSDIRDFTPLSETLHPQELVSFLNAYFAHVTAPLAAHNGVINKFIGDAVMAIFSPVFGSADHAGDAVRAALAMGRELERFNAGRPGRAPVRAGVGLHTGTLVAGNIGTETRLEFTVIGDTVNVASRIESMTKELECSLLISAATHDALSVTQRSGLRLERCEDVRMKGKVRGFTLYKASAAA